MNITGIENVIEITYEGKTGFFIPPDLLYHYHDIVTNLYPKAINETIPALNKKINIMQSWIDWKSKLFNEAIEKYEKVMVTNRMLVGIAIGTTFVALAILAGMILSAVLPSYYQNKYAYH